jgi:hypothetical protein
MHSPDEQQQSIRYQEPLQPARCLTAPDSSEFDRGGADGD